MWCGSCSRTAPIRESRTPTSARQVRDHCVCDCHHVVLLLLLTAHARVLAEEAALDEGHDELVEEFFGHPARSQRKDRAAQRKRQRREEDAEYDDADADADPNQRTREQQRHTSRAANEEDEEEGVHQQEATAPLRRSRRLRGQKVDLTD